jgi:hypothetical protein
MLVATDRFPGDSIYVTEPVDPRTNQDGVNRRRRDPELATDLNRSEPATPPKFNDRPANGRRRRVRVSVRT